MAAAIDTKVRFPIALKLILSSAAIIAVVAVGFVASSLMKYCGVNERINRVRSNFISKIGKKSLNANSIYTVTYGS